MKIKIYRCTRCGGTDINYRSYGEEPQINVTACFSCMKITVDEMYQSRIKLSAVTLTEESRG